MSNSSVFSFLNYLQEVVFILDDSRRILYANKVAEATFGKIDTNSDIVRIIRHPELMGMIEQVQKGSDEIENSIKIESPISGEYNVLVSRFAAEQSESIIVSLLDVSARKQVEQVRSDFVANVSHELRSPLTGLAGFIETLKGPAKDDSEAQARFLDLMDREVWRMTRLVSDLLSLSKLQATESVIQKEDCDLANIIQRVTAMFSEMSGNDYKIIELNIEKADLIVSGSNDSLVQLFQNLIENALKYSSANSTVKVGVSVVEDVVGIDARAIEIAVTDQGNGIPQEHIPRLTERFYRVDSDRSREKGGTGLGLAIVKHIINQHRGRLKIESEVGVGSTFTVYLPLKR